MAKAFDPLYSRDGGPPGAFRCLLKSTEPGGAADGRICGHICRTAQGIEGHLRMVHNYRGQITLDELIERERNEGR